MKVFAVTDHFGLDNLRLTDWPEPSLPNPREVLIEVKAVSLNYRDLMMVEGTYNPKQPLPLIPCSDALGKVVDIGTEVTRFQAGDRVAPIFCQKWISGGPTREHLRSSLGGPLQGTLAELMVVNEKSLVSVPEHLSDEEASTLPCAAVTAWNAVVEQGETGPEDTVLIQGGGGVSLFALQFAKVAGAKVIGVSSSEERLEQLRMLGADEVLLRTPGWSSHVKGLTGGNGANLIVEVGGGDSLAESLGAVGIGGRIVLIGAVSGGVPRIRLASIFMRYVRIQGILVGNREMFEEMNRTVAREQLHPVIDRVFEFKEAARAFRYFSKRKHFGKVSLRFS